MPNINTGAVLPCNISSSLWSMVSTPLVSMMTALSRLSRLLGVANNCLKRVAPSLLMNQQQYSSKYVRMTMPRIPEYVIHHKLPWIPQAPTHQIEIPDTSIMDEKLTDEVMNAINEQVTTDTTSRLFAVVHICGKQFKVTENDIVVIQGYWPPNPGDQLKLEKVLLCGSTDFTLIGRPTLNRELVTVNATVIEKTFSHTKTRFRMRPRKQYRRIHFYRIQHTMLRINSISINGKVDEKKEVEGLDRIY